MQKQPFCYIVAARRLRRWICLVVQTWSTTNRKKSRCDFKQSIRKDTFFNRSHLSIYQIVMVSYICGRRMCLFFLCENKLKLNNNQLLIGRLSIAKLSSVEWYYGMKKLVIFVFILLKAKIIFFNYLLYLLRRWWWKTCRNRRIKIW